MGIDEMLSRTARGAEAEEQRRREERAMEDLLQFPFVDALFGRRSRRFFRGAEIPDGTLAFKSRHEPIRLTELERMLILTAAAGNTGWHHPITRHERYAPHLSNYPGPAGGRTFPSAAGFHTAELFFTDDSGTYIFQTRDAPALGQRDPAGKLSVVDLVKAHAARVRKISEKRVWLPPREPYMEEHNTWVANRPGSLLLIPVGDVAQHAIANLCFFTQNGYCIYDDVNRRAIPGLEQFADIVDVANPLPLTCPVRMRLCPVQIDALLTVEGRKMLFVGGATSSDRVLRTSGRDYWPDERFYLDEQRVAGLNLERLWTVVTHTAPDFAPPLRPQTLPSSVVPGNPNLSTDLHRERSAVSRLHTLVSTRARPPYWFYGHFHAAAREDIVGTRFVMVASMEMYPI